MQTMKVKFDSGAAKEMASVFLSKMQMKSATPTFVFLRKGTKIELDTSADTVQATITPPAHIKHTKKQKQFEFFLWAQIQVRIKIENRHDSNVTLYWVHGAEARPKGMLAPGEHVVHHSSLSHVWMAFDARHTGTQLSEGASLGVWKVTRDDDQTFLVRSKACMDLDGQCDFWVRGIE